MKLKLFLIFILFGLIFVIASYIGDVRKIYKNLAATQLSIQKSVQVTKAVNRDTFEVAANAESNNGSDSQIESIPFLEKKVSDLKDYVERIEAIKKINERTTPAKEKSELFRLIDELTQARLKLAQMKVSQLEKVMGEL